MTFSGGMTPLDCAKGIVDYLQRCCKFYDETYRMDFGEELVKPVQIYAGFLPRARTKADMQKLCPAIVVRPELIDDNKEDTKVSLVAYVTVYDDDLQSGNESLYHLLEFIRYVLLSQNPIDDKWQIVNDTIKTTIPDEQPFPQWLGAMEFEIYIPQPTWTPPNITGEVPWQKHKEKFPP